MARKEEPKKGKYLERLDVKIEPELKARIVAQAQRQGMPASSWARQKLSLAVEKDEIDDPSRKR